LKASPPTATTIVDPTTTKTVTKEQIERDTSSITDIEDYNDMPPLSDEPLAFIEETPLEPIAEESKVMNIAAPTVSNEEKQALKQWIENDKIDNGLKFGSPQDDKLNMGFPQGIQYLRRSRSDDDIPAPRLRLIDRIGFTPESTKLVLVHEDGVDTIQYAHELATTEDKNVDSTPLLLGMEEGLTDTINRQIDLTEDTSINQVEPYETPVKQAPLPPPSPAPSPTTNKGIIQKGLEFFTNKMTPSVGKHVSVPTNNHTEETNAEQSTVQNEDTTTWSQVVRKKGRKEVFQSPGPNRGTNQRAKTVRPPSPAGLNDSRETLSEPSSTTSKDPSDDPSYTPSTGGGGSKKNKRSRAKGKYRKYHKNKGRDFR
jgi:hypothetical protein